MSIGIALNVDARTVRSAKQEVEFLNKTLKETENLAEQTTVGEGFADYSEIVKRLSEDIRRLKGIATSGDRQGGLLRKEQFVEAEKLSTRIRENFTAYGKDLAKAREELTRLVRERETLEKAGASGKYESPEAHARRMERLGIVKGDEAAREAELQKLLKHQGRISGLRSQGEEATSAIGGLGSVPGAGFPIKKMLGVGAALLGGMSVLQFLNDSMSKAIAFGAGESDLTMRGGRNLRSNASTYGFAPIDSLSILDSLNRSTGMGGGSLGRLGETAKMFSRGRGLSEDEVTGYMGGIYQATGLTAPLFEKHMERLRDSVEKSGVGGRSGEFLRLNQQLLSRIAQGMGAEVNGQELQWLTALQSGLWSMPGMSGKGEMGADILSRLDQGIRGGGKSPGEQLFLFRALNGGGVTTTDEYMQFLGRREKGLGDPRNLKAVFELAKKEFGSDDSGRLSSTGRLSLMSLFGLTTKQADMLSDMGSQGMFDENAMRKFVEAGGNMRGDAARAMGTPGGAHRQVVADIEELKLIIGEGVLPAVDLLKGGLASAGKALIEFARDLGVEEQPLNPGVGGDVPQASPDDPMYAYKKNKVYRWLSNTSRKLLRSASGDTPDQETAGGGSAGVDDIAERIGQKVEEALERQRNRVQRVEIVGGQGQAPGRPAGSGR